MFSLVGTVSELSTLSPESYQPVYSWVTAVVTLAVTAVSSVVAHRQKKRAQKKAAIEERNARISEQQFSQSNLSAGSPLRSVPRKAKQTAQPTNYTPLAITGAIVVGGLLLFRRK